MVFYSAAATVASATYCIRSYNPLKYVLEGLVLVFTTKYERMKTSFSNVHAWFHGQAVVYSLEQNQKHTNIHTTYSTRELRKK